MADRRALVAIGWDYYKGDHAPNLLPTNEVDQNNNVVINMCEIVVDYTVSYLFPEMPTLELENDSETQTELDLRQMWSDSGEASLLTKMAMNGAVAGHCFARLVLDDEGAPLKFVGLNPSTIIAWWAEDDVEQLVAYELRFGDGKGMGRQMIYRDQNNPAQWIIEDWILLKTASETAIEGDTAGKEVWKMEDKPDIWIYAIPPVVDWQHLPLPNSYYGKGELNHLSLNDSVNKTASDIKSTLRYHAYPKMYAIGISKQEKEVQHGINQLITVENPAGKVGYVEMESDMQSSMNYIEMLRNTFYSISRTVVFTGDIDIFRGMTNLGVRTAFMPMQIKNNTLRRNYGNGIKLLSVLWQLVTGGSEPIIPKINWKEALPKDNLEEMSVIEKELAQGLISKRQATEIRGRKYEDVRADLEKEMLEVDLFSQPTAIGISDGIVA
jgi:hypothetical protein